MLRTPAPAQGPPMMFAANIARTSLVIETRKICIHPDLDPKARIPMLETAWPGEPRSNELGEYEKEKGADAIDHPHYAFTQRRVPFPVFPLHQSTLW
jgi:hypothetical protein